MPRKSSKVMKLAGKTPAPRPPAEPAKRKAATKRKS